MIVLKFAHLTFHVMLGLVLGIHALFCDKKGMDGQDIGERSDAVLRTAMPGHDELKVSESGRGECSRLGTNEIASDSHNFRSATSSTMWLSPFFRMRSARCRVGRMFSCRFTRLMRSQIEVAVAAASSSLSFE